MNMQNCKIKSLQDNIAAMGDSGWVYFTIDDETCNEPQAEALVDMMYEVLDYGSWAGEFSANGEALYNKDTKLFEGIDRYDETDSTTCNTDIKLVIPAHIGFDHVNIHYDGSGGDNLETVEVKFIITNGFNDPLADNVAESLEKSLIQEFDFALDEACRNSDVEYAGAWNDISFKREEFVRKGKNLELSITKLEYNYYNTTEKDVQINLAEMLETEGGNDEL